MALEDPWPQIRTDLLALREDAQFSMFSSLLDRLLTWVDAKPISAAEMRVVVDMVRGLRQRLQEGASPKEVLSEAKEGDVRFDQPNWDPNTVNQAMNMFQLVLNQSQPDIQTHVPRFWLRLSRVLAAGLRLPDAPARSSSRAWSLSCCIWASRSRSARAAG